MPLAPSKRHERMALQDDEQVAHECSAAGAASKRRKLQARKAALRMLGRHESGQDADPWDAVEEAWGPKEVYDDASGALSMQEEDEDTSSDDSDDTGLRRAILA